MVTARGKPSGTATTSTVTPMMKNLTKNCMYMGVHSLIHGTPWIQKVSTKKSTIRMTTVMPDIKRPGKKEEKEKNTSMSCETYELDQK